MILPNLGKAWIEGREKAIERNWKDLMNFEAVEAARTKNDMSNLELLAERAKFGGNMSMFQNLVDASARANEVAEHAQAGLIANANLQSMQNMDSRNAYVQYRPQAQQALYETGAANAEYDMTNAKKKFGESSYMNEVGDDGNTRAFSLGRGTGEAQYNAGVSQNQVTNIRSEAAPTVAQTDTQTAIANSAAAANAAESGKYISAILNNTAVKQADIELAARETATPYAAQGLMQRMRDTNSQLQKAVQDGNEAEAVRLNEQATRLQQIFQQTIRQHPELGSEFLNDPDFKANAAFFLQQYHPQLFSRNPPKDEAINVVQGTPNADVGNAVAAFNRNLNSGVVPAIPAPSNIPPQSFAKVRVPQQQPANLINEGMALRAKRVELLNSALNSGNLSPAEQVEAKRQRLDLMRQLGQQMTTVNGGW